ncbi:hypothetical protein D1872_288060 [compost metagenome]
MDLTRKQVVRDQQQIEMVQGMNVGVSNRMPGRRDSNPLPKRDRLVTVQVVVPVLASVPVRPRARIRVRERVRVRIK